MSEHITYVRNPIARPDEPRHFMVLESLSHEVVATWNGRELARTRSAVRMHEAGYDLYDPVVYFRRADVNMDALRVGSKTTHCPLKGTTSTSIWSRAIASSRTRRGRSSRCASSILASNSYGDGSRSPRRRSRSSSARSGASESRS